MNKTIKDYCDSIRRSCATLNPNDYREVADALLEIEKLANVPGKIARVVVRSVKTGKMANFTNTYDYATQSDREFVHSIANQYRRAGYEVCIVTSERGV